MASLINRIQRAFLGSAGEAKVRALLAELAIPAGGSGGSMREVRRGFLRPISDEAILRNALGNLGLNGDGGGGAQSLSKIRTAVLHNQRDSETTLRDGLNGLLAPDDLGEEGGGTTTPDWLEAFRAPSGDLPRAGFTLVDGAVKCWDGTTDAIAITDLITNGSVDGSGLILTAVAPQFTLSASFFGKMKFSATYRFNANYSQGDGSVVSLLGAGASPLKYASIYHNYISNTSDDFDTNYVEASTSGPGSGKTAATITLDKVAISQDGEATVVTTGSIDFVSNEIVSIRVYGFTLVGFVGHMITLFVYDQQSDNDLVALST